MSGRLFLFQQPFYWDAITFLVVLNLYYEYLLPYDILHIDSSSYSYVLYIYIYIYIYKYCLLRKNLSRLEGKTSQQINQRYTRTFFENRNTQEQKIVL